MKREYDECFICHFCRPLNAPDDVQIEARVIGVLIASLKFTEGSIVRSFCDRHLELVDAYGLVQRLVQSAIGCGKADCPTCSDNTEHPSCQDRHVS